MLIKALLLILTLLVSSPRAWAEELFEEYTSLRALGMGNAYSAIVDNEDILFYNPASLCRAPLFRVVLINPGVAASGVDLIQEITTLSSAKDSSEYASTLQKMYGKETSLGFNLKAVVQIPCFEVAAFGGFNFAAKLDNPAFPNLYIRSITDYGVGSGFAFDLVPGFMTMGLGFRGIQRTGSNVPIGPSVLGTLSSTDLKDQLANTGMGYAMDGAVNLTLPTPLKPTFTAVFKDIGDTTFTKAQGLAAPPSTKSSFNVGGGLAMETLLPSVRPAFDIRHVNDQTIQLGKKVHVGAEVAIPFIALRGGLYQGYYTAGVGVNMGLLRVDAATWGVELGEYPGQDESRRYGVQAKVEFSFDANFSFKSISGWGGGRKKLKQRR